MRAWPWALCGGMLLAMGCVTHRGPWRLDAERAQASPSDGVELVLLANLGPNDRRVRGVVTQVERVLAEDRPRVVLWLGNMAAAPMRSAAPSAERRAPSCNEADPVADALAELVGQPSYAVGGVLDHRCGAATVPRDGRAWRRPGSHYVLRVHTDGSVQERAVCRDGGCTFAEGATPDATPLVDLVMIDLSPWLHPSSDPAARRRDELEVRALEAMLTAIADVPSQAAPPRLLVSSVPVEAGGEHGLGALWPDATFHSLPPHLQDMLVRAEFAGVLAGHDRSLYATEDISDAVKRADRAWLRAPMFQVVAGAMSKPNRRAAMALRRRRLRTSQAHAPPVWSDHAGFAVVHLRAEEAEIVLHAHRGRHWEAASITVPLRPIPHPIRTSSPHMAPCRDCPPIPASER